MRLSLYCNTGMNGTPPLYVQGFALFQLICVLNVNYN